jgi:predicted protein tyrosine phosphatase
MQHVHFFPRSVMESIAGNASIPVISIRDPEGFATSSVYADLQPGWKEVLYLSFHDSVGNEEGLVHFDEAVAREVLAFLEKHAESDTLYVHCIAGQSRSAAIAQYVADRFQATLHQEQRRITQDRPYTKYNSYVYKTLMLTADPKPTSDYDTLFSGLL